MMSQTTTEGDVHLFVPLNGDTHRLRLTLRHNTEGRQTWIALARGFNGVFTFRADLIPAVRAALARLVDGTP